MAIIDLNNKQQYQGKRICLGNFDGFHVGHQALAKSADVLVTFDPHPKEVLTKKTIHRLTTPDELKTYVPNVLLIEFTPTIQRMPADVFLNEIMAQLSPTVLPLVTIFALALMGKAISIH